MAQAEIGDNRATVIGDLRALLGQEHVITDEKEREFFSTDVFYKADEVAEFVIAPGNKNELAQAIGMTTRAGFAVVPRGGGMSYTGGYRPIRGDTVIVDMRRLDRIVEINEEDMYVTVECGVTWKKLYEALKERGLRTPYFGPFSGMYATVGGALSQNSIFFGSSIHGSAAEAALSLEVVLADGTVLKTGSAASVHNPSPFFRTYGPDLTGLFLGDTGALGFKIQATLRLIPFPAEQRFASFSFDTDKQMFGAMTQIARERLAEECYGFDPFLLGLRLKFEGLAQDIKSLAAVAKSGKTLIGGLRDAAKIAVAGRRFMEGVNYGMHTVIEGRDAADAESALRRIRAIASENGGREIENSLPKLVRANPFLPTNRLLGPEGERWVPVHVILPHSRVAAMLKALDAYFNANAQMVEENSIQWGYLTSTIGTSATLIEPTFFWPDSHYQIHERYIEDAHYAKLKKFPENLKARNAMAKIRGDLADLFMAHGGAHLQIGKMYRYRESRDPATWKLIEGIKALVDPSGAVNPGSLGLGS
ncbi:MAG: FAD-binding oxidoreductase [Proteobacteria bacterium]|nr:FAD-binding oxidoreductase [Pseudomonadota bacterium]